MNKYFTLLRLNLLYIKKSHKKKKKIYNLHEKFFDTTKTRGKCIKMF